MDTIHPKDACEAYVAEHTRRIVFLEKLKQAHAEGRIPSKAFREMWKCYHEVYSIPDVAALDDIYPETRLITAQQLQEEAL